MADGEATPGRRQRSHPSVRARVLAWVMVVAAVGMVVAGAASYLVQRGRVDARIDDNLAQEVGEFRAFAREGIDPETGAPFASVSRLFTVALQRNVPDEHESLLVLVDGDVPFTPAGDRSLRLETLPELVDEVRPVSGTDAVRIATVDTEDAGTIRYTAIPVTTTTDPARGVLVVGYARDREQGELVDAARTYAVVALVSLLLVAAIGWAVAGRLLLPLRLLRDTARRISETDLHERIPVSGRDDLSDLARTFNLMLDRLEAAFDGQRQLLDDVGHELRTPVTIVRGHVELMDAGDPTDVAQTRDLVLDELDRMHRLVDDLVLLAKARRPDFLRWDVVHVSSLVDDVVDKARALGDRRWQVDARADAVVAGDPQRLTQALVQLAANAVTHTRRGDVVALGSASDGRTVQMWVRDIGPGVAPEDAERIFERFGRGAGARGSDGSGLGLAIVTAIADAHGGRVRLESEPGRGATFVVELPEPGTDGAPPPGTTAEDADVGPHESRVDWTRTLPVEQRS